MKSVMPSPELLKECEELALRLAPEMSAAPMYCMNKPPSFVPTVNVVAFAYEGANNFDLRDALIAEGRWKGNGAAIVYCQAASRPTVLGSTIHELSHLLPFAKPPADIPPSEEGRTMQRLVMSAGLNVHRDETEPRVRPTWYPSHGWRFIRRCIHLHHRAWKLGFEIGLPEIQFAGWFYDLSPAWRFMRALGDEPKRMDGAIFAEIEATKPPKVFADLFISDIEKWFSEKRKHQSSPEEQQCQKV